jgi:hypothetical protein
MFPFARRLRWWVHGEETPLLRELMADPDRVLASARSVAREQGGRKRFYRVQEPGAGRALFVKVFNLDSPAARLRYFGRRSKARLEQAVATGIRERGFDAALPAAIGEERRAGLLLRSIAAIPELPAIDLRSWFLERDPTPAQRRALLEDFARFNRALHDAGIDQDDTAPNNFLMHADGRFALIDFERCALRARPLPEPRRWRLLAKIFRHQIGVSAAEKLRFLRAYVGPETGAAGRRRAWLAIRSELARLRRHDARRAGAAAFKLGRHLVREGNVWLMRARRDAPVQRRVLDRARARSAWVRAHQLERLSLPALRPVRLDGTAVELLLPTGAREAAPTPVDVRVARGKFEACGRFAAEPHWLAADGGAWLTNPECFEIDP